MIIPQKMKQVQISAYGPASGLKLVEVDTPQPAPGQLLVKFEAAGVNYSDILRRRNTYFMPTPLPYALGAEAAGKIVALGEGVDAPPFQIGNSVLAILPHGSGYSEYVVADANYCVPLPPQINPATATAIFVQGTTAYLILHKVVQTIKGKSVLIHAGASGVGTILIQLAKMAGAAKVIATGSSSTKLNTITSLGADAAIDYTETNWPEKVIAANNGDKVDFVLEMVGGTVYTQSFSCLKQGGTMVVYGAASGTKGIIHSEHFVDESHNLLSFNLAYFVMERMPDWQEALGSIIGLIAEGKLNILVENTYNINDVVKAHTDIEERKTTGKVVLTF